MPQARIFLIFRGASCHLFPSCGRYQKRVTNFCERLQKQLSLPFPQASLEMEVNARIYGHSSRVRACVCVLSCLAGVTHTPRGLLSGPKQITCQRGLPAKSRLPRDEPKSYMSSSSKIPELGLHALTKTPDGVLPVPSQSWTLKNVASAPDPKSLSSHRLVPNTSFV